MFMPSGQIKQLHAILSGSGGLFPTVHGIDVMWGDVEKKLQGGINEENAFAVVRGVKTLQEYLKSVQDICKEADKVLDVVSQKAKEQRRVAAPKDSFRAALTRLAQENPALRRHLIPLLRKDACGDEMLSRYEEGKPADPTKNMSPEDAKKWKQQTEEHKDEFKSAAAHPWDAIDIREMRDLLKDAGYNPKDAKKLQAEGMGPEELKVRLEEPGGLERTHRLKKVGGAAC